MNVSLLVGLPTKKEGWTNASDGRLLVKLASETLAKDDTRFG